MSKRKRRTKHRRTAVCQRCAAPADTTPAGLLAALAAALNACETAGLSVRLKHGAAYTRHGYVLPLCDSRWGARTLTYTEFTPPDDGDDD